MIDEEAFQRTVRSQWNYHSPCDQVAWQSELLENGTCRFDIAPVYQELWGGENDGKRVWTALDYDLAGLSREPGIEFDGFGGASKWEGHTKTAFLGISGNYFGEPFVLRIHLEPFPGSPTREVVDVLRHEIRAIEDESER